MKRRRWSIIHEDEDIIVVDKTAPYLTIPDRYDKTIPCLLSTLSENRTEVFVNHRLDKETSGLILFTKNADAHKFVSELFVEGKVDKHYLTLVKGVPSEEVGLVDLPIAEGSHNKKGMVVSPAGKSAQTKFRIVEKWNRYSLLEIKLLTGRQHQIRVHMKAIRCPVVCDQLYGDGKPFFLSSIKRRLNRRREDVEKPLLRRQALHSHLLSFQHPTSKEMLSFKSELHKDMRAMVNQLRKHG